jgi:hypothetical protein
MGNVKLFRSTDYGAPILYGNAGYMIPVLQACLVDGYGTNNVTSITHSGGTVTVTTQNAHGLKDYSRQTIAGVSNDTAYNGEYIITVTGTNTFTYSKAGITSTPGTGTITTKSAGAGWTKPYSGTNLAAFRQGGGNQRYLRIDDTTTITCRVVGYESMSDVNTGTGPFPTAAQFTGGLYFQKSQTADATNAREWIIIADDRQFFLWVNWDSTTSHGGTPLVTFGDFVSYKSGDAYNTHLLANISGAIAGFRFSYINAQVQTADTGHYVPRSYTQIGTSMPCARVSDYSKGNAQLNMGAATATGLPYPHPVDGGLWMAPVWIAETATTALQSVVRGVMNGVWNPLHAKPFNTGDTFQGTGDLSGKTFFVLNCQLSAEVIIEIPLTWTW